MALIIKSNGGGSRFELKEVGMETVRLKAPKQNAHVQVLCRRGDSWPMNHVGKRFKLAYCLELQDLKFGSTKSTKSTGDSLVGYNQTPI